MKTIKTIVNEKTIIGKHPTGKYVVNISSLPYGMINQLYARFPSYKGNPTVLRLYSSILYTYDGKKIKAKSEKRKAVTYICDDDDRYSDYKIRNLNMVNNWAASHKLIIGKEKTITKDVLDTGRILRTANHNHTEEVLKKIDAIPLNQKKFVNISMCRIVKTDDDRAGSIAGMTYALRVYNIPYEIVDATVSYKECWLCTKRKIKLNDITPISRNPKDNFKTTDKAWDFKTGFGGLLNTQNGIFETEVTKAKNVPKKRTIFSIIADWLTNLAKRIINYLFNVRG